MPPSPPSGEETLLVEVVQAEANVHHLQVGQPLAQRSEMADFRPFSGCHESALRCAHTHHIAKLGLPGASGGDLIC